MASQKKNKSPAARSIAVLGLIAALFALRGNAQEAYAVSEADYLAEMPVVLSVSRLPQRLDETPGAVTLIDRSMIRLSGARDLADLMRLVPGFQTSMSFELGGPQASYHGAFGGFSNRIQVLVDGRSVYSPYFVGSVEAGLQTVALQDIERIEVLRGSNSAAYGARAFLGVINIVTRDSADTAGTQLRLSRGSDGIQDSGARIGGASGNTSYRLSVDRRADDGLQGAAGRNRIDRVGLRADFRPNASDEIQLRAGTLSIGTGKGFVDAIDDPARDTRYGSGYVQVDWHHSLNADHDLALNYSHSEESYQDKVLFSLIPVGINDSLYIDASGRSGNDNLSLQHTWRQSPDFRLVWGAEFRREAITSRPAFNTDDALITDFTRLFANAEWRLVKDLVLNAGAMAEKSSVNGNSIAPRLMLNWRFADGQTVRVGASTAYRPPSDYEKFADVRYYWHGQLLRVTTQASGTVQPEHIFAREIGYLGALASVNLQFDVRVFHERIGDFIRQLNTAVPKDYANLDNFSIQGLEYEMRWRPWAGTRFRLTQAYVRNNVADQYSPLGAGMSLVAPQIASTLAYVQQLPGGLTFSLTHQNSSKQTLPGAGLLDQTTIRRTDLRLAAPLQIGGKAAELALVLQNAGSPVMDFAPAFAFQRRAFVTLQLDN